MQHFIFFLMRHLILILLSLYVAVGFIYRHAIFGIEKPRQVEEQVSAEAPADEPQQPPSTEPVPMDSEPSSPMMKAQKPSDFQFRPDTTSADSVSVDSSNSGRLDGMLKSARALADQGDFNAAEIAYLELVGKFPDDAAPFGELGNLYLAHQQQEKAAEAYYQAGMRIDYGKDPGRIEFLLQTLQQLEPDKAAMLRHHLGIVEKQ